MNKMMPAGRFFGTSSLFTALPGIEVSELVYAPSVVLPSHAHARANFCFVLRGCYEETCGRSSHQHVASHLIFHPAGQLHSDRHAPAPVRLLSVELAPERLEQIGRRSDVFSSGQAITGGPAPHLCRRLHHEICQPDDVSSLAIEGLVLEILAALARESRRASEPPLPGWMRCVEELLRARCLGAIHLGQLAAEVSIHPVHLARTFRAVYGCSPAEYIRRLRVEAASRHLQNSKRSLGEIAHLAGFADQSHLTRTFRRFTGVTPGEFRRQSGE